MQEYIMVEAFQDRPTTILVLSCLLTVTFSLLLASLLRLASILTRPKSSSCRPPSSQTNPTHLLVVLGSGGHTAEMLNILSSIPDLRRQFTYRTYVVSSGDGFSALKAKEFEEDLLGKENMFVSDDLPGGYTVATVRRARRVHQSFLTAPWTSLLSLWDCLLVLRGTHPDLHSQNLKLYPDLILTNGPGTGVCVILASLILLFFGFGGTPIHGKAKHDSGQMRSIFVESWARVNTLSLSGRILKPLVNKFLVQWPQLAKIQGDSVEYIGPLVS